jgi:hypothetical protein
VKEGRRSEGRKEEKKGKKGRKKGKEGRKEGRKEGLIHSLVLKPTVCWVMSSWVHKQYLFALWGGVHKGIPKMARVSFNEPDSALRGGTNTSEVSLSVISRRCGESQFQSSLGKTPSQPIKSRARWHTVIPATQEV